MLSTRLVIGFTMVGLILAVLCLDEWLAPWFPLWFLCSAGAVGAAALELVGLMQGTSARPSGNTVFGGVLALVLANWGPHLVPQFHPRGWPLGHPPFDPSEPVTALAW